MTPFADTLVNLDPLLLLLLSGLVIPLLTALATKVGTSNVWRVAVSLALSTGAGTLVAINHNGGTFYLKQTAVAVTVSYGASVLSYLGLWSPTVNPNATVLPRFGFGPKS